MSLLFLWLKTWQAIFARRLQGQISGRIAPALTLSRFARVALIQAILQPSALFLLPLALLITLPFGWVYAFYQNVTAFGAEDGTEAKQVFKRALKQARLWPRQNHLLLGILVLFGAVVFLDVAVGLVQVPSLLKTFFGLETAFTRSSWSFLNTTFLATVCGLTFLCLDPLLKTVYLLRCFYGESLHTGEDLKAELKLFAPPARAAATVLVLVSLICNGLAGTPADSGVRVPSSEVSPSELNRSIEQVLNRREYNWRLPREKPAKDQTKKGSFTAFLEGLGKTIRGWASAIVNAAKVVARRVADVVEWLRKKIFGGRAPAPEGGSAGMGWMVFLQALIFVLLALAVCAAATLFLRNWKRRGARAEASSQALAPLPDLADEGLTANQLPEDDWLRLARELMGKGELRLALRALYLASLAHLAQREMISVAKFKSNRDYEQELRRRARALPDLQAAFAENVNIFDRVWYGLHEVTQEALQRFQINLERIKAC